MVPRLIETNGGRVTTLSTTVSRSISFSVPISATKKRRTTPIPSPASQGVQISPYLASVLRPQAAQRWQMPWLANITPMYVESTLKGAIAGDHVRAWELFDLMIDTDPEIHACIGEYVDGVTNKKLVVTPYREEDEEPTDRATEKARVCYAALRNMRPSAASDENGLKGTVRDIVSSRWFGQALLEVDWYDSFGDNPSLPFIKDIGDLGKVWCPRSTMWVHPVCYAWSMTGRLGLRFGLADMQLVTRSIQEAKKLGTYTPAMVDPSVFNQISSQPMPGNLTELIPDKFIIGTMKSKTGTPLSASDLRCLAWWWCASNFCGDWLLNYAQLFGIPFRKASYTPGTEPAVVEDIKQMLAACGSAGYIVLPEGANVEFEKGGGHAGDSPQGFLFHFADEQKRKVILRQTMTGGGARHGGMGKGGGQAFGNVEANKTAECIQSGADYAAEQISNQLIPSILRKNYGKGGDSEAPIASLVDFEEGQKEDAERDQVLSGLMNIPANYLHQKYRIPKPKAGDKIAGVDVGANSVGQMSKQQNLGGGGVSMDSAPNAQDVAVTKGTEAEARRALLSKHSNRKPNPIEAGGSTAEKGCLMAMVPSALAQKLINFAVQEISPNTITGDGIEDEPHVTVLYGFKVGTDKKDIETQISGDPTATATLGKISRFECPDKGYDVLIVEVSSPEFEELNEELSSGMGGSITPSEYDYHPHLTLAYVEPGTNKQLDGSPVFQGEKFVVSSLLYSDPGRTNRSFIPLKSERMSARGVIEAKLASISNDLVAEALKVFDETVQPMRDRLKAIAAVEDVETKKKLLKKFIRDYTATASAMKHDDSLARLVGKQVADGLVKGLEEKSK